MSKPNSPTRRALGSKPAILHGYQERGVRLLTRPGGSGLFLDPG